MNPLTKEQIKALVGSPIAPRQTKGERAEQLYPDVEYDTAIPQQWANELAKRSGALMGDIVRQMVWAYDDAHIFGRPLPLTEEAFKILEAEGLL